MHVSCVAGVSNLLILAYSWARPATLAAGGGRGGNVFTSVFFFHFLPCPSECFYFFCFFHFLPCPSLSSPVLSLLSFISLSLGDGFKKGSCQFLAKECAQYWLTA